MASSSGTHGLDREVGSASASHPEPRSKMEVETSQLCVPAQSDLMALAASVWHELTEKPSSQLPVGVPKLAKETSEMVASSSVHVSWRRARFDGASW